MILEIVLAEGWMTVERPIAGRRWVECQKKRRW